MTQETRNRLLWTTAFDRARRMASRSEAPTKFMNDFDDELRHLSVRGIAGELDMIATTIDWTDPVHVAAEAEALAAYRTLTKQGVAWGLIPDTDSQAA